MDADAVQALFNRLATLQIEQLLHFFHSPGGIRYIELQKQRARLQTRAILEFATTAIARGDASLPTPDLARTPKGAEAEKAVPKLSWVKALASTVEDRSSPSVPPGTL